MDWELRSITAINRSPLNGVATTLERAGASWSATFRYESLAENERARMQQFLANCRGHGSRLYAPYYGWTRRGSFPATELFTNTAFSSTTGWTPTNSTLTANDGLLRATVTTPAANVLVGQSVGLTQYAPYALRSLVLNGRGTSALNVGPAITDSVQQVTSYDATRSLKTVSLVALSASAGTQCPVVFSSTTGFIAGDYIEVGYTSLARCALVDNGTNLLQRSDEFDNAYWTKTNCSISANATTSPDGNTTADALIEDASTAQHFVIGSLTVSSAVAEYTVGIAIKANGRSWAVVGMSEGSGSTSVFDYFNLSTGAVGVNGATGANWSNRRSFVVSLGDSWYMCCIVARKTNAATTVSPFIVSATADGTSSYTGTNGLSAIRLWRATAAQSSVPTRLVQTTSAASTGTSQTGGGLYLKGLPASTSGLLLQGDPAEVMSPSGNSQLVRTRTPLSSDAAGLGYFEFEAPIRVSPSDGAAVIIHNPLCRMMMDSNVAGWSEHSGGFSDLEFTAVEDTYP